MPDAPAPKAHFVARERELARLEHALEQALGGELAICLIEGEAGSGKTALVTEFARRATGSNEALVLAFGECNAQSGAGDPFLPFREVLSSLMDGGTAGSPAGSAEGVREDYLRLSLRALADNAPDLVGLFIPAGAILARLGGLAARRLPWAERLQESLRSTTGADSPSSAVDQTQLFEQYTKVLRAVSRERPLLLVLDDLQWVDPASAGLFFHLVRRLRDCPILVLGGYRPEEVSLGRGGDRHPLEPVLNELKRYHGDIVVDLGREEEEQDRRRLDALVDLQANGLGVAFRRALYAHTRGQPLFTLELLHNLEERGDLARDGSGRWVEARPLDWAAMPARVEGVIGERIARLQDELRQMLLVASVEGEDFTAEVVARVRAMSERDAVRQLSGELDKQHRLVGARELRRLGEQRISLYQFRHNLIQKYLYQSLDDAERSYLHEDVGTVLETLYGERAEEAAFQLARHFEEAGRFGKALHYRQLAAERARRLHANSEAIDHYQRALALVDSAAQPAEPARACMLCEGLGDVEELSGRHARAVAAYERAMVLAPECCTPVGLARIWRKAARARSADRQTAEAVTAFDEADRALGDPAAHADPTWRDEWVQLQLDRLAHFYWMGDWRQMEAVTEHAGPMVAEHGSPRARAEFWHRQVLMQYRRSRFVPDENTGRMIQTALTAAEESDGQATAFIRFGVGFDHLWARRLDPAEQHLRGALEAARSTGDVVLELRCVVYLAVARRFRRDLPGTAALAREALELAQSIASLEYIAAAEANLAWVAAEEARFEDAIQLAESALVHWAAPGLVYPLQWLAFWPLIHATLERGDPAVACSHARRLHGMETEQRMPPAVQEALTRAVETCAADPAEAGRAALLEAVQQARTAGLL